jgi:hypothetical protein
MKFSSPVRSTAIAALLVLAAAPAFSQGGTTPQAPRANAASTVRLAGVVRDETNAIPLPGIPVEVAGQTVFTDVDGRFVVDVPAGEYELKVEMQGYETKTIKVTAGAQRNVVVDVGLTMTRFAESITVVGAAVDVETSTAEAQLIQRRESQVITDNMGSQEMKQNGDSDAAAAMSRVTGLSVVDNQYIYVRGLGERYSNTTLAGSVIPTTEPDKKVVPLDLFPSGLIDSVQVAKSYTPDKSSEFAGGLVQIVPLKFPSQPTLDFSYGTSYYSTSTGKSIPLSPLGRRDWLGYDDGARALPSGIPNTKIVRRGIFTPDVGFSPEEITQFGRLMAADNTWRPRFADGAPGQNWGAVFGNRYDKLGIVASVSQSYKEQAVTEQRRFFHVAEGSGSDVELEALSDYALQYGTQKAQLGVVGNLAYQFTTNHRLSIENFYTHSGRDEGRHYEGFNLDNNRVYRDDRLQFIEEELFSNAVGGEHFFQQLFSSRLDWRVNSARAKRDEPRLREVYYEFIPPAAGAATPPFVLSDESQSGFQMFSNLDDKTVDASVNWSLFRTVGRPTQFKFGTSYIDRSRDFASRRFRFIPITTQKADTGNLLYDNKLPPEELFVSDNIGTAFRFNEETRATDAYDGAQTTTSAFGMVDVAFSAQSRLVAGLRIERFNQEVNSFDPFSLVAERITAENKNTDFFPAVNFVQALNRSTNLRLSYSTTVNRPEFRELAAFEFTDVVGNRAVRGNPELKRALIHNVDGRWEMFSGGRDVLAASLFYKYFDQPIESVVLGAAQPIATFQNSDHARNVGLELEAAREIGQFFFLSANYTFVDSKITLLPEQTTVQTSLERALTGQSKNLFNLAAEGTVRGFSARILFNYFGDRITEAGANDAPDIIEQGRGSLDLVFSQRVQRFNVRLTLENLTNSKYLFTQGDEEQRIYKLGRTVGLSFGYSLF